jgi:acyl dehydratase
VPADNVPEYRVKARNTAERSENPIHADAVARRHGFPGALVPGVTTYAYLTHPLVSAFGADWLDRGTATLRLLKPVLPGDELTISGSVTHRDASEVTVSLAACTATGDARATLVATVPADAPAPVDVTAYRMTPLPAERPPVSREHLLGTRDLGTPTTRYDAARAAEYLTAIEDSSPIYRGAEARIHPAFYLDQANRALDQNVRLGPWVHIASGIRHLGAAREGETLRTLGRVQSVSETKGREIVELDLLIVAGDAARPVAHVSHSAIYRLPSTL